MIRAHILPMFLRNIAIKGELQRIAKVVETVGNKGKAAISGGFQSVEMRGIEPRSESNLERTSPGAVCYLHSLSRARTNTLTALVESLCMGESTLSRRTVTTQITP